MTDVVCAWLCACASRAQWPEYEWHELEMGVLPTQSVESEVAKSWQDLQQQVRLQACLETCGPACGTQRGGLAGQWRTAPRRPRPPLVIFPPPPPLALSSESRACRLARRVARFLGACSPALPPAALGDAAPAAAEPGLLSEWSHIAAACVLCGAVLLGRAGGGGPREPAGGRGGVPAGQAAHARGHAAAGVHAGAPSPERDALIARSRGGQREGMEASAQMGALIAGERWRPGVPCRWPCIRRRRSCRCPRSDTSLTTSDDPHGRLEREKMHSQRKRAFLLLRRRILLDVADPV